MVGALPLSGAIKGFSPCAMFWWEAFQHSPASAKNSLAQWHERVIRCAVAAPSYNRTPARAVGPRRWTASASATTTACPAPPSWPSTTPGSSSSLGLVASGAGVPPDHFADFDAVSLKTCNSTVRSGHHICIVALHTPTAANIPFYSPWVLFLCDSILNDRNHKK